MRYDRLAAASGLALVIGLVPAASQAADLVQTLQNQEQFSELAGALEKAGLTETLKGEGPFTVFAPTNEAFEKLPQGAMSQLQGDQLGQVLKHHVVQGKEVMAKDILGQETQVETVSGDQITVDGTGTIVVLVPAGLAVTRVGDEVFVQRRVAAVAAPAVTVQTGQSQGQQQATSGSSSGQQGSASSGQQQAGANYTGQEAGPDDPTQQQGQQQAGAQQQGQQGQQAGAQQQGQQGQQQAGAQQQAGGQGTPMDQQQGMLRAAMVVEPDIQADNGVIHGIDEVLVPQKIEQQLQSSQSGQGQQQQQQQGQSGQQG